MTGRIRRSRKINKVNEIINNDQSTNIDKSNYSDTTTINIDTSVKITYFGDRCNAEKLRRSLVL